MEFFAALFRYYAIGVFCQSKVVDKIETEIRDFYSQSNLPKIDNRLKLLFEVSVLKMLKLLLVVCRKDKFCLRAGKDTHPVGVAADKLVSHEQRHLNTICGELVLWPRGIVGGGGTRRLNLFKLEIVARKAERALGLQVKFLLLIRTKGLTE